VWCRGQEDVLACMQTTAVGSLQVHSASRFVGMCLIVGAGPGLDVLLEPILLQLQSITESHTLRVGSKMGRAASFFSLV